MRMATKVAAQIRPAIADREAKPGDRLPPARHLSAVMQVNTNTVSRAPEAPPRGFWSCGRVTGSEWSEP
jgi:DNA-binding transcriptional MocR family regulator